jgi:ureidoglycolate lyase
MSFSSITIHALDAAACAPYGIMLGKPPHADADAPAFLSPSSDFWREHLFDTGAPGETEILWVRYRNGERGFESLEAHCLTQQAIVPLTGPVVQIVATSHDDGTPNLASLRAFLIPVGAGLCMFPRTWHATRVMQEEVTCLMLTYDLAVHLRTGAPASETQIQAIEPHRLVPDSARAASSSSSSSDDGHPLPVGDSRSQEPAGADQLPL